MRKQTEAPEISRGLLLWYNKIMAILFSLFLLAFTVNPQSTYDVPYGTNDVLILDATLSEPVQSIEIHNTGNADNTVISELMILGDGASPGFDGDEKELARVLYSPFFDWQISGNFDARIFVTIDLKPNFINQKTITPQLLVGGEVKATGLERIIRHDASAPTAPMTPLAKNGEALSSTSVRWHFTDLSNNEFGFKILDSSLKEVAQNEGENVSFVDETGLQPDTEYSGRLVVSFNDRGTSLTTALSNFTAVRTLKEESKEMEEAPPQEIETPESQGEESTAKSLQEKIEALQLQLIDLLEQLVEVLQKQIGDAQANIFSAFSTFTLWFESFF